MFTRNNLPAVLSFAKQFNHMLKTTGKKKLSKFQPLLEMQLLIFPMIFPNSFWKELLFWYLSVQLALSGSHLRWADYPRVIKQKFRNKHNKINRKMWKLFLGWLWQNQSKSICQKRAVVIPANNQGPDLNRNNYFRFSLTLYIPASVPISSPLL